jgi:hypothetical protein
MAITKSTIALTVDSSVSNYFKIIRKDINLSKLVNNFLKLQMASQKHNQDVEELKEDLRISSDKILDEENRRNLIFIQLQEAELEAQNDRKENQEEYKKQREEESQIGQYLKMNNRELLD